MALFLGQRAIHMHWIEPWEDPPGGSAASVQQTSLQLGWARKVLRPSADLRPGTVLQGCGRRRVLSVEGVSLEAGLQLQAHSVPWRGQ